MPTGASVPPTLLSAHPGSYAGTVRGIGVERCPNLVGDDLHLFSRCSAYEGPFPRHPFFGPSDMWCLAYNGVAHALGRDHRQDRTRHMVNGKYAAREGPAHPYNALG